MVQGLSQDMIHGPVRTWFRVSVRTWLRVSVRTWFRVSVRTWFRASVRRWFRVSVRTWFRASVRTWFRVSVRTWFRVSVRTWFRASVRTWFRVSVRIWFRGQFLPLRLRRQSPPSCGRVNILPLDNGQFLLSLHQMQARSQLQFGHARLRQGLQRASIIEGLSGYIVEEITTQRHVLI